jgi:two-component system chemotaxis sensor kinase CheA
MDAEIVREFLLELDEKLDMLDSELINLERDPGNAQTLGTIFRALHTIKGTCAFMGFDKLQAISHVGEGLLVKMRDGEVLPNAEITTALLALSDAIRKMLLAIVVGEDDDDYDYAAVVTALTRLAAPDAKLAVPMMVATLAGAARPGEPRAASSSDSLRIDIELLDHLLHLVDELVLARNDIVRCAPAERDSVLADAIRRLDVVTVELQGDIAKTRRQPIDHVWSNFPRMVRDLALECGKQVRVETHGENTDLDKTIIDAIRDPLIQIVRNSVDHGIEAPQVRVGRGKPPEGVVRLCARHEGTHITITIADDGEGMNIASILSKATERGLLTLEQAGAMADRDVLRLAFMPGVSTADSLSTISGRGVGLDIVKTNIEKVGGQVDIQSFRGGGTSFTITIPSTLEAGVDAWPFEIGVGR